MPNFASKQPCTLPYWEALALHSSSGFPFLTLPTYPTWTARFSVKLLSKFAQRPVLKWVKGSILGGAGACTSGLSFFIGSDGGVGESAVGVTGKGTAHALEAMMRARIKRFLCILVCWENVVGQGRLVELLYGVGGDRF